VARNVSSGQIEPRPTGPALSPFAKFDQGRSQLPRRGKRAASSHGDSKAPALGGAYGGRERGANVGVLTVLLPLARLRWSQRCGGEGNTVRTRSRRVRVCGWVLEIGAGWLLVESGTKRPLHLASEIAVSHRAFGSFWLLAERTTRPRSASLKGRVRVDRSERPTARAMSVVASPPAANRAPRTSRMAASSASTCVRPGRGTSSGLREGSRLSEVSDPGGPLTRRRRVGMLKGG
jgi:hypothetical protein